MAKVTGDQMTWHKITLDFEAPQNFTENASTFRDYRLDVTFTNADTGEVITVPGFFAADGDAANTNATSGNIWRANFNPPSEGNWTYTASFRTGDDIAAKTYQEAPNAGQAVSFIDGDTGTFAVTKSDKSGEDFRAKGMIVQDEGTHFLQHQGDGDYFVRGGPGVPENFLANKDFDNTANGRHDFATHVQHFKGDGETWDGGKGAAILGAVNYLAENGQNTIYMLTNTSGGDGQDVSPWTFAAQNTPKFDKGIGNNEKDKFSTYDVSKLAQWEIVFDHMDDKGIYKNVLLQETENDQQLDGGTNASGTTLSVERMVYMREMVARFGHNNGIQWNLGEENTNTNAQRKDMAEYMKSVDGYDHLVTIHSFPNQIDQVYNPLLGVNEFDGASFQTSRSQIRDRIEEFRDKSAANGDKWVLTWDEDASGTGKLEAGDTNFDAPNQKGQRDAFWGTLTAGGSGGNWYLKDDNAFSLDQNYDDFTQHKALWTWTAAATEFFNTYIPFWEMRQADGLTSDNDDYVMAKDGEYYVIYLPYGEAGDVKLNLNGQAGETFDVFWYNPRTGGDLIPDGSVDGGGIRQIGGAPQDGGKDWVLLVRNQDAPEFPGGTPPTNNPTPPAPTPTPTPPPTATDGAFQGENGTIVIQAESAEPQGSWRQTTIDGKTVLLWDAPSSNYGKVDPNEALTYNFVTDEAGNYFIGLNSGRVKSTMGQSELFENGKARTDTGNDVYVAVIDVATGEVVQKPTKLFTNLGGSDRELRFGSTFDANHQKSAAAVQLDANKEYRLEITGRSDGYALDMITLNKGSVLQNANAPESQKVDGQAPTPPAPTPPVNPGPNNAPVAEDDTASTGQNKTIMVDVLANDSDADGDNLTLIDVKYTGNTSIVSIKNGQIEVNPLSAAKNARTEVIEYTVSDGKGGTDTATLEVQIGGGGTPAPTPTPTPTPPANQAPVAKDDKASTAQNTTIMVDVLANDSDPEGGTLTLTDVKYDGTTSLVSIKDGQIEVNPLKAATNTRTEVIEYTVTDDKGASRTATLEVEIEGGSMVSPSPAPTPPTPPANQAPNAVDDSASTGQNNTIVVDVLANDSDPNGDSLTLTDVKYDGNTSIVSIVDGKISVNPLSAVKNARTEVIEYTVEDAKGATSTATLEVAVGGSSGGGNNGGGSPAPAPAPTGNLAADADHIIFHFDGNNNDPDDIAAIPVAALLASAGGVADKTTFAYGNNFAEKGFSTRFDKMDQGARLAEKLGIDTLSYEDGVNKTTDALVKILNSGQKVLMIEGGPMEAAYRAIDKMNPAYHDNVTLISHSSWNENRDVVNAPGITQARTWSDLKQDFPKLNFIDIADQNAGSNNNSGFNNKNWSWMDQSNDPLIQEARAAMELAGGTKENDPSDAGMLFYALTGKQNGTANDAKAYLDKYLGDGAAPNPAPTPTPTPAGDAYQGKNGTIVMQAESADAQGNWRKTNVDGETVMLWDAPSSNYSKVDPNETLSYNFVTDEAGNYHIGLHSGRVKSTMGQSELFENGKARTDTGNDAYVAVIDVATGEVVQKPTKLFTGLGGSDRDLRFGSTFDANHKKSPATVELEAGKEYRLEITGRSDGYALDMITLNKGGVLKNANAPESAKVKGSDPVTPEPGPGKSAPIARDDKAQTEQNKTVVVDVLANDSDPDGGKLTLTDFKYDGNTSLVSIENGQIKVNPLQAATNDRTEVIEYTVKDDEGVSRTATLEVDIGAGGMFDQNDDQDLFEVFIANATTDKTIREINAGDTVAKGAVGNNANIYITAKDPGLDVDYVELTLGDQTRTEKVAPYAVFGDNNGDFLDGVNLAAGRHVLEYKAYDNAGALIEEDAMAFWIG